MSLINVVNLSFAYEGSYDNIFENVNFQIDTDWKLGFIGRNGRGKTTFFRLLMKQFEYKGNIFCNEKFEYFPYIVKNKEVLTSVVIGSMCSEAQDWQIEKELNALGVTIDALSRNFSTLSNGEQTKVLLAALFLNQNCFLLIDEPTNHLDIEARQAVAKYLNSKKGFILVSHDRAFVDNCVDHILSINKTNIEVQKGNFSSWWDNKQAIDLAEIAENGKLKKDIKRLEEASKRKSDWSEVAEKAKFGKQESGLKADKGFVGHKAAKVMKSAKVIELRAQNAIDEKSQLLKNVERCDGLKMNCQNYFRDKLVEVSNLSIFYGENCVCKNLNFNIERGDRVAIKGKNGCGKSSLIKLICGDTISFEGNFEKNSQLKISYVAQCALGLSGKLCDYAKACNIDESMFKTILAKFDFSKTQLEKEIQSLSEGQKKKVMLARSLCEEAHLFVWDEPLNYIDIFSRMQIEDVLTQYKPTILFVEHDKAFCDNVATKIIYL